MSTTDSNTQHHSNDNTPEQSTSSNEDATVQGDVGTAKNQPRSFAGDGSDKKRDSGSGLDSLGGGRLP